MDFDKLTAKGRNVLNSLRGFPRQVTDEVRKLTPDKHTPAFIASEARRHKDDAMQKAREFLASSGIEAELTAGMTAAKAVTRRGIIAGARCTSLANLDVTSSLYEKSMLRMQSEQNERSAELFWLTKAQLLTETELAQQFDAALSRREYAVVNVCLREAETRAARSTTGTDAEHIAGTGIRMQAHAMQQHLEAHAMPVAAAAEVAAAELGLLQSWITEATAAIETGTDRGLISQTAWDNRDATNEQKQAAMSAVRNAA
jgi:hypothetical protein